MINKKRWKLRSTSYQIADTGDYDGHYEITNEKVSIFSKDDDDEALQKVVDAFNNSGCDFYLDDSDKVQIHLLEYQVEDLNKSINEARKDEAYEFSKWKAKHNWYYVGNNFYQKDRNTLTNHHLDDLYELFKNR